MVVGSLLKLGETDFRRKDRELQNAIRLCRLPGGVKWMLLNHRTGLVLYVRTGN
jgi:hypothetical protein